MKAKELRIGNYVISQYNELKAIDFSDYLWYFSQEQGFCLDWSSHTPIPLTEEWLVNFGFKCEGEWFIMYDYPICINVSIKHNKTTYGYNEEYEILNIVFVHQLQNLYFALTNEELTIK